MADLMDEAIEISHKLIPCNICGRTFLPSPLKKHAKVCEKNATRKRKTFNSLKQRIEGTELAVFHQKTFLRPTAATATTTTTASVTQIVPVSVTAATTGATPAGTALQQQQHKPKQQSKWKEKHEQLVQAIRAAKGEKVMAPRRSISSVGSMGTTEQCPTCDRHFGPKAYDRHVEWCKEHKIRASKSPAIVTIAKERLEARTKYRVPPLNKSKRSLTRDKYASPSGRNHSQDGGGCGGGMNVRSTSSLEQQQHSHSGGNTRKHKQKHVAPVPTAAAAEPVIKHNSEKLKSFGKNKTNNNRHHHHHVHHPLSPLKRSLSLASNPNPVVKARSMKNKQDIQDYLHVREQKKDELFPVGHDMYNEYKKYEDMYRSEQIQMQDDDDDDQEMAAHIQNDNDDMSLSSNEELDSTPPSVQPERHYNTQKQKVNADSAYGSLNRKSPKIQQSPKNKIKTTTSTKQQQQQQQQQQMKQRSPSSSGSDTCTRTSVHVVAQSQSQQQKCSNSNRLTKFCHECGTKYPLDSAKFCVECGIKRLVL